MVCTHAQSCLTLVTPWTVTRQAHLRRSSLERAIAADPTDVVAGNIVKGRLTFGTLSVVLFVLLLI